MSCLFASFVFLYTRKKYFIIKIFSEDDNKNLHMHDFVHYNIALFNSERSLARSRVDITK